MINARVVAADRRDGADVDKFHSKSDLRNSDKKCDAAAELPIWGAAVPGIVIAERSINMIPRGWLHVVHLFR